MSTSDAEPPLDVDAAATAVISLPSDASAAAIARQFVEDNRDHIRADLVEDAQLLVSEVVTNALRLNSNGVVRWPHSNRSVCRRLAITAKARR
jgi:hypothetical protein